MARREVFFFPFLNFLSLSLFPVFPPDDFVATIVFTCLRLLAWIVWKCRSVRRW